MAETDFYNTINKPQLPPNPTKFYTHFLYKAILVSIFVLVLPLFPSQAPEFINQTINTRSWELLQLLFVGIAVSYGLFSKRNEETEKEQGSTKFDSAQSYVARLLQVSSVFDDESENPSGSEDNSKVQTWNSQYYRGEPIVVVAKENSVLDEQNGGGGSQKLEKPLLLPVRSLKNGVSEAPLIDSVSNESKENSLGRSSSSRSNSRRFSRNSSKSRGGEFRGVSPEHLEEKEDENIVYRSPIPWRSRSGRMEVKEDLENSSPPPPPMFSQTPSMEDDSFELNPIESRSFRYQPSKFSNSSSQNKVYPSSPTFSSEIQAKSLEDVVPRKKISQKSSFSSIPPPPPPPPPPPHFLQRSPTMNSNYSQKNENGYAGKELRRSVRSFPAKISRNEAEDLQNRGRTGVEFTIRTQSDGSLMGGRSFRAMKAMESDEGLTDKEIESFIERRGQQTSKFMRETTPFVAKQTFADYPDEDKKEFVEKIVTENGHDSEETGEEDEEEEEEEEKNDKFVELPSKNEENMGMKDGGGDVDKKADEFIAKFREQIRLQRIASIRRSTGEITKNAVR